MTLEEAIAQCNAKELKRRRTTSKDEHNLQKECVKWFREEYPQYLIFAIGNGGYRGSHTRMVTSKLSEATLVGKMMKDEGVTAGAPDLCIPVPMKGFGALYIEMKYQKRGVVSKRQEEFIEKLRSFRNCVVVVRNKTDFQNVVRRYFS